ncbi:MAG TPA: hypothetical protein VMU39_27695, partial [Solirubrobacteraceae bacterium]|nr:hypothetical protein [Solirubrobacteraceae bacterium]
MRRRSSACVLVLCGAIAILLGSAPAASAASCTDTWTAAGSGSWNDVGNWSAGVPTSTSDVCIPDIGKSYMVTLTDGATAKSLTLGATSGAATQVLDLLAPPGHNATLAFTADSTIAQTGELVFDSQAGGGFTQVSSSATLTNNGTITAQVGGSNVNYLDANLHNAASGTLHVTSGELRQDTATATTNDGALIVDASSQFTLTSGSAAVANDTGATVTNNGAITLTSGASWSQLGGGESANPVTMFGGTLTDHGAGSGGFTLIDNTAISGTIGANETVDLTGTPGHNASATFAAGIVTNNGTLILDTRSGGGYAALTNGTLNNNGTLTAQAEGSNIDYLEVTLNNAHGAHLHITSGNLRQDTATTTTNDGAVIVDASSQFTLTSGSALLANDTGATVANSGAITLTSGASWTQAGGAETGSPVTMFSGTLTDSGTGSGGFTLIDNPAISGTIGPSETVELAGTPGHNATATLHAPSVTNNGTLV